MTQLKIPLETRPAEGAGKELLERVSYFDSSITSARLDGSLLVLEVTENAKVDGEALGSSVAELLKSLNEAAAKEFSEVLAASAHSPQFTENPWPDLLGARLVKQIAPGYCYLSGEFAELVDFIDSLFKAYAASLGAVSESYTSTLPIESMIGNGYLESFPHHALFVAAAHQSFSALQRLAKVHHQQMLEPSQLLGQPRQLLAPTVCFHCFEGLRGTEIQGEAIYSARALCHRNEGSHTDTLLRLKTFSMREIVFLGSARYVEQTRRTITEYCTSLFEYLQLKYRLITASDAFFASAAQQRRIFQKLARSKIELQLYVPYCDTWVAVASFNDHASSLTAKYAIKPHGVCSGCFGVGYERLAYALVSQLGRDLPGIDRALRSYRPN